MSSPFLSFPTQPSPSQPNPPLKPYRQCGARLAEVGLVTKSSLGGKRDEPTASGNTGPGCGLDSIPGCAGVPKNMVIAVRYPTWRHLLELWQVLRERTNGNEEQGSGRGN